MCTIGSDDGRTVSTVKRKRHSSQEYQPFLSPCRRAGVMLCERVRQRVAVPMCTTDVWPGVTYC